MCDAPCQPVGFDGFAAADGAEVGPKLGDFDPVLGETAAFVVLALQLLRARADDGDRSAGIRSQPHPSIGQQQSGDGRRHVLRADAEHDRLAPLEPMGDEQLDCMPDRRGHVRCRIPKPGGESDLERIQLAGHDRGARAFQHQPRRLRQDIDGIVARFELGRAAIGVMQRDGADLPAPGKSAA